MVTNFRSIAAAGLAVSLALPIVVSAQDIYLASGGADQMWKGTAAGMNAGAWMDLGSVTTDSRRDLIVGSPGTGSLAGAVYVIFGGPDRTGEISLSNADTIITSTEAGNRFGAAIATGNILNTDGSNPKNLIIGAPGAFGGRGAVYVFTTGYAVDDRFSVADAVYTIIGASGDQLGSALATADLDKDGYREMIVGAPGHGRVYVIKGSPSLSGTLDLSTSAAAAIYTAAGIGNVLMAGDITGDGIYDLLVGDPSQNVVFAYVGSIGTIPSVPAISFTGVNTGDEAGSAIRILDIDADGKSDLVIGAPGGDGPANGRANAGNVYLFLGPVSTGSHSLSEANVVFYGAAAGYRAGEKLATGDINRDTPNDLVILAPGGSGGAGELDIYYGRARTSIGVLQGTQRIVDMATAGQVNRHIFGDPAAGSIGATQVYEVTGEGARDIIVGVPTQDAGAGKLFFTISPRLQVSPLSTSLVVNENNTVTSTTSISVTNPSVVVTGWQAVSNVSWLTASPASGSIDETHPGAFYLVANASGVTPGIYNALMNVSATSPDLTMTLPVAVSVTVTGARLAIDTPSAGAIVSNGFTIAGWAVDVASTTDTGIAAVDAYAYPASGAPIFLGRASYGAARPDVGSLYGSRFTNSGYSLQVSNLTPGATYDIAVFAKSSVTNAYANAKVVNVTVSSSSPGPTLPGPTDPNPTPPPNPSPTGPGGPTTPPGPTADTRIAVNRTGLFFGATNNGAVKTGPQTVTVTFTGGSAAWSVSSDATWFTVSPVSGSGARTLTVTVNPGTYPAGVQMSGTITVTAPGVANSPVTVPVSLMGVGVSANPFGIVDTPADNAQGVVGAIPVTGWAEDDIGIAKVTLWRDPIAGEPASSFNGKVFIGNTVQVEGARPDVDAAYSLPYDYKAGWGYLLLTNMLPNQGNGTFKLYVYAEDIEGHTVLLGTRTITCDNAHAVRPFGSIDTPDQGGTASGSAYVNFGWALTPQPNVIATDGSGITVFIDGVPVGHPVYNQPRSDISTLFPGRANSNGAVGYFQFDSTLLANAVHTIAWGVVDGGGNVEGMGSRYFTVLNGGAASTLTSQAQSPFDAPQVRQGAPAASASVGQPVSSLDAAPVSAQPAYAQTGFAANAPLEIADVQEGAPAVVKTEELGLLRVTVGPPVTFSGDGYEGYLVNGGDLQALPPGSFLDKNSGEFFWQPGVGFVGTYDLVFVRNANGARVRIPLTVQIAPRRQDNEMLLPSRTVRY